MGPGVWNSSTTWSSTTSWCCRWGGVGSNTRCPIRTRRVDIRSGQLTRIARTAAAKGAGGRMRMLSAGLRTMAEAAPLRPRRGRRPIIAKAVLTELAGRGGEAVAESRLARCEANLEIRAFGAYAGHWESVAADWCRWTTHNWSAAEASLWGLEQSRRGCSSGEARTRHQSGWEALGAYAVMALTVLDG